MKKPSKNRQLTSVPKGKEIVYFWTRKAGPIEHKKNKIKKVKENEWLDENSSDSEQE